MTDFCRAQWPNLGPAGGLWTCTLDAGHDGDHEAQGPGGRRLGSASSFISQGDEAIEAHAAGRLDRHATDGDDHE